MNLPQLICKTKTPKVFWYQNDDNIIIRIMLCDVKNYNLKIVPNHFRFSTSLDGNIHYLCFQLYGSIHPDETRHINLGREIKVYLSKVHKFLDWLRLTYHKEKNHLIIADPDHIFKTDWSNPRILFEGKECFADFKAKNNLYNINPVIPSSDEEESDDERLQLTSCD